MQTALLWIAVIDLLLAAVFISQLVWGLRQIRFLREERGRPPADSLPRVSIVVAARNEERGIAAGLKSLIAQDYDDYELIVVNDRSTDRTGEIVRELQRGHPFVQVIDIEELPAGWLGKNHALDFGSRQATGEYLLFTDADIVMAADTLKLAVSYLQRERLDHLTITPDTTMPSAILTCFAAVFINFFCTFFRPWKAKDAKSKRFVGIGAFNMVRRQVYQQIDGHRPLAMRPDDDVKLGKLIKLRGFRQEMVNGAEIISVEWYSSVRELIVGLEKNAFAGVGYRVWLIVLATLFLLVVDVWPFVGVFVAHGPARWLYLAVIIALMSVTAQNVVMLRANVLCSLFFPLVILLFIFISWRSMLLTYINQGIRWRGTHYPLAELRANDF